MDDSSIAGRTENLRREIGLIQQEECSYRGHGIQSSLDRADHAEREGRVRGLMQLYQLLEQYAPWWYTQEHREIVEAALKALKDCATKPHPGSDILARLEASLPVTDQGVQKFGDLCVDLGRMEVKLKNRLIHLSAREFQLLRYLVERVGIAVSRTELLRSVWGYDANIVTRTLDVHVASLRRKLEKYPGLPHMIVTVPGMGYRLDRIT